MRSLDREDRPLAAVFFLVLAASLYCLTLSWHRSLLDRHEFRQTQTAISAYWIREAGPRLDYETPIFGPPWSVPFEFPVYQDVVAAVSAASHLPLEQSARAVSIFFLLATLPAVMRCAALFGLGRGPQLLVAAAVVSSPVYLFYGRSFMIETTALCFSAWFLVTLAHAVRDLSPRWAVAAAVTGALAALAKITTFAVFCPAAAALALWFGWPHRAKNFRRAALCAVLPVAFAVALGAWWIHHGDAVKAANPFARTMQSADLREWTWGTLGDRVSPDYWADLWVNLTDNILSPVALVVSTLAAAALSGRALLLVLAGLGSFLTGPLMFANLYHRHDYYFAATAIFLAGVAGGALAAAWAGRQVPRRLLGCALVLFFAGQGNSFYRSYDSYHRAGPRFPPDIARVIAAVTRPDEVILVYGWDWNTLVPYYAGRRAVMLPRGHEWDSAGLDEILARLPPLHLGALLVKPDSFGPPPDFARQRARELDFLPAPIATSPDGDLYVRRTAAAGAMQAVTGRRFGDVVLHDATAAAADPEAVDPAQLDFSPVVTPRAVQARSRFGLTRATEDGQPVLLANPPCEIWLEPAAGATTIEVEFGLVPASYTGAPPATDGVGITIFAEDAAGARRRIFRRELAPATRPDDRGVQRAVIDLGAPRPVRIGFVVDPGPVGDLSKDWFYWRKIAVR